MSVSVLPLGRPVVRVRGAPTAELRCPGTLRLHGRPVVCRRLLLTGYATGLFTIVCGKCKTPVEVER